MRALLSGSCLLAALCCAAPAVALTAGPDDHAFVPAPATASVLPPSSAPAPVSVAALTPPPAMAIAPVVAYVPLPAPPLDPTTHDLNVASGPENTPERQAARDRLFHELVPQLDRHGLDPTAADTGLMLRGLGDFPCAAGGLRIDRARILGEAATVNVAGGQGGCSVLMRRTVDGWHLVMVLGWTLRG